VTQRCGWGGRWKAWECERKDETGKRGWGVKRGGRGGADHERRRSATSRIRNRRLEMLRA
jgi:hypothetical protein